MYKISPVMRSALASLKILKKPKRSGQQAGMITETKPYAE
jgi:hypothetical protein